MKILSVVGARPQIIKVALVAKILREKKIPHVLLHTGQHYDYEMSALFFRELEIPTPDYNLNVGSGSHAQQTAGMIVGVESVLLKEKPNIVVVYGDTNSTLAGALAAAKLGIAVAHVEAGLRSYNRKMPEEINRIVVDHISDILFAPTTSAVQNLRRENIKREVYFVGDVMYDVLCFYEGMARSGEVLCKLGIKPAQYLLATVHRAENTDSKKNLQSIMEALSNAPYTVVLPLHPRTEKMMKKFGLQYSENVIKIKPLGYLEFITVLRHAKKVLTDSGGVQKEAYILGIPCITLRNETEWVETVNDGWNVLVGADTSKILRAIKEFSPSSQRKTHYGDGKAAEKIVDILARAAEA